MRTFALSVLGATLPALVFAGEDHSVIMSNIQSIPDSYFGAGNTIDITVKDFGELGSKDSHLNISGDGYVTYEPSSYSDDSPYKGITEHTNVQFSGGTFNFSEFNNTYITVTGTTEDGVEHNTYLNNSVINDSLLYVQSGDGVQNTTVKGGSQVVVSNRFFNWGGTQYIYPNNPSIKNTTYFDTSSELLEAGSGNDEYSATSYDSTFHDASSQRVMINGVSERSSFYNTSKQLVEAGGYVKELSLHDQASSFASAGSIVQGTTSVNDDASFILELKDGLSSAADKIFLNDKNSRFIIYSNDSIDGNEASVNELYNVGEVIFTSKNNDAFSTLIVNGDYTGVNGSLVMNGSLNGDSDSVTDKLLVKGNTAGQTYVAVNNIGGHGDITINGIEIIEVDGQSDGIFEKKGRITAGAYDYDLIKKGNNWYLSSNTTPDPTPDPTPGHKVRPEAASYIGNMAAANTLFNTRLHDRLGETQYIDALTGQKKVTSLWLRQVGGHNNWRDSSGQLKTQSNSYVAQLGGDVAQWSTDGLNRGHLGLMAGYANSHNQTHSSVTSYGSKGSVSGYSTGVYGTWFANDADKSGLYVDSWLQYSWFDNHVNGEKLAGESYKSKGLTASLETGYTLKMGEFTGSKGTLNAWFVQPQAQATWMGVEADKHREDNGTRVNSEGDGNVQTRLGMRTYLKSHHAMDGGKGRTFEPFIEANWLHNTRSYSAKMDDVRISQAGARNIGEVKVGLEGQINSRLNLWGNVGTQVGDKGYNDSTAMIGVKYNF